MLNQGNTHARGHDDEIGSLFTGQMLAGAGLMQGLPDGSEEARLQEIEAEVEQHAAALKQVKAQNRQACTHPLQ